jgi:hypothetical protein
VWGLNVTDGFSVKSLYLYLEHLVLPQHMLSLLQAFSFRTIWKSAVPSKVGAFAWQLFLDRIPTKQNLSRRVILRHDEATCVSCVVGQLKILAICLCSVTMLLLFGMQLVGGWEWW